MRTPEELAVELQGIMDVLNCTLTDDDLASLLGGYPVLEDYGMGSWKAISAISKDGLQVDYYDEWKQYKFETIEYTDIPSEMLYMFINEIKNKLKENPKFPL
jgi:hypothetical protein